MQLIFDLPLPPSANRIWRRSGTIIHKSAEYTAWITAAGWDIAAQRKGAEMIKGRVSVLIEVGKCHAGRDASNQIKPIEDLLQSCGVIKNDNQVDDVRCVRRFDAIAPGRVAVTVQSIAG